MKAICVVAGNLREFNYFIVEKCQNAKSFTVYQNRAIIDGVRYIYVSQPRNLRGLKFDDIIYYGTFHTRPARELDEIREIAQYHLQRKIEP